MNVKVAFQGTINVSDQDDVERTLDDMPLIKDVFFTGNPSSSTRDVIVKALCKNSQDVIELEKAISKVRGITDLQKWPEEQQGLTAIQKSILLRATMLAVITFVSVIAAVAGVLRPDLNSLLLTSAIPAIIAFCYEIFYNWKIFFPIKEP
ncbi:MAG: hypothetical protein HMLIMOIP_001795 [Candidatus Nitrosomirales archaeon]